ncbi:MAG: glycerate kinase type-2 family protein [Candidatus Helarchaeota archaeon]
MQLIKNSIELMNFSQSNSRKKLLFLLEKTLQHLNPKNLIKNKVKILNDYLKIDEYEFDLNKFEKIQVFGVGKASGYMAEGLESILKGKRISGTIIIIKGTKKNYQLKNIKILEGTHPIPSELNITSTNLFLKDLEKVTENDLVIFLISGGGSALLCNPEKGISLADLQSLNKILLNSGLDIIQINTIRKHISKVKGGKLLNHVNGATNLSLLISDVLGDPIEYIASGPTYPDTSTFSDSIEILNKLEKNILPPSIENYLREGVRGLTLETLKPGDPIFKRSFHKILGNITLACNYLKELAIKNHVNAKIYSTKLQGEAREVGEKLLIEASTLRKESDLPVLLISGGETTVTVKGNGIGGRNSELVLGALLHAKNYKNFALVSIGTDGNDNSKDFEIAGAIIDDNSVIKALEKKLDIKKYLEQNDSHTFFRKLGGSIITTGDTGNNMADLMLVYME